MDCLCDCPTTTLLSAQPKTNATPVTTLNLSLKIPPGKRPCRCCKLYCTVQGFPNRNLATPLISLTHPSFYFSLQGVATFTMHDTSLSGLFLSRTEYNPIYPPFKENHKGITLRLFLFLYFVLSASHLACWSKGQDKRFESSSIVQDATT